VTPDVVVAGAGMAGLAAAAHARELGARVLHLEKAAAPGGAMRHSSGVFWRHASFEAFRAECPDGDEALQRALFERLDGDLDWLESRGARVTEPRTGNPRTVGRRFDTASVVAALAGELECSAPLDELPAFRADPEASYLASLDRCGDLGARVRAGLGARGRRGAGDGSGQRPGDRQRPVRRRAGGRRDRRRAGRRGAAGP